MRVAGLDADVLSANPQLKAVGKHGVGVDSIDLDYCRAHGIAVVNTPTPTACRWPSTPSP